jgi:hypothetical protein
MSTPFCKQVVDLLATFIICRYLLHHLTHRMKQVHLSHSVLEPVAALLLHHATIVQRA